MKMCIKKLSLDKIFCMKCTFYFFKMFGVATVNLNVNTLSNTTTQYSLFCFSKKGVMYNIFFICCAIALNSFSILFLRGNFFYKKVQFELIIDGVNDALVILSAIIILIIFCFRQSTIISLANEFKTIVKHCEIVTDQILYRRRLLLKKIGGVFLANFVMWFLMFCTIFRTLEGIIYSLSLEMCNSVLKALIIQYIIILKMINEVYIIINETLLDIFKKCKHRCLIQTIRHNYTQDRLQRLSKLHQLCLQLSKICIDVSKFYSLPILLYIFYTFVLVILGGYYLSKPVVLGKNNLPIVTYIHHFFYVQHFAICLILLTISVTDTVDEVTFKIRISLKIYFKSRNKYYSILISSVEKRKRS